MRGPARDGQPYRDAGRDDEHAEHARGGHGGVPEQRSAW